MLRRLAAVLILAGFSTTGVAAQVPFSQGFTFVSASGGNFDNYRGQFNAPVSGATGELAGSVFQVWCVDPMQVVHIGDTYAATITPFNASTSNFGATMAEVTQAAGGIVHVGVSGATAQADYLKAAWLASQMTVANSNDYEHAIWQVMGYVGAAGWNTSTVNNIIAGITAADLNSIVLADWGVISDGKTEQEFIYHHADVAPEPATMSLMAMGLAGLTGASFRRRKRSQQA